MDIITNAGIALCAAAGLVYVLVGQMPGTQVAGTGIEAKAAKAVSYVFAKPQLVALVLFGLIALKLLDWLLANMGKAIGSIALTFILNLLVSNLKICLNYLIAPAGGRVAMQAQELQVAGINLTKLPAVALTTGAAILAFGIAFGMVNTGRIPGRR
ncbi:MAG: hypothetical protein ISS87_02350 [Candidatus Pacebacteria bacterium]|nr:hypothetical protein [Candidatus Paceibacterota bacterium]